MQGDTLKQLRQKYKVTPSEELRNMMRDQAKIKGKITKAVSAQKKTIPEIAKEIAMDLPTATYYVLTLTHYKVLQAMDKNEYGYWRYQTARGGR
jgi:predicted HTH transcriptional regulator